MNRIKKKLSKKVELIIEYFPFTYAVLFFPITCGVMFLGFIISELKERDRQLLEKIQKLEKKEEQFLEKIQEFAAK